MAASACWAGATCAGAMQPLRALVVLRRAQELELSADGAAVEVDGSGEEGCAPDATRRGGESEVVVALRDGGGSVPDFELSVVDAVAEDGRSRGAGVRACVAEVLPEALIEVCGCRR